jgi:serine/threonine protein kinase
MSTTEQPSLASAQSFQGNPNDAASPAGRTTSAAPTITGNDCVGEREEFERTREHNIPYPKIPGFQVIAELGRGGMGVVFKARQESLNRDVAIKMLLHSSYKETTHRARLMREAEAIARLSHPNIVQIYQVGEVDGNPFCVLEFAEGGSLASHLQGVPQGLPEAAQLVETLARAIHVAHERKIIHRDLKPANILISKDGTPKIADFGLARTLDKDTLLTASGAVLGTVCYMAPEQARGEAQNIGFATDTYALGVILYEMITGQPPFRGATVLETLEYVAKKQPIAPSQLRPTVPAGLDAICLKCLKKDPQDRYPTALGLADALHRWLSSGPRPAQLRWQDTSLSRTGIWKFAAAIGVTMLVAILAGVGGYALGKQRNPDETPESLGQTGLSEAEAGIKLPPDTPEGAMARIRLDKAQATKRCEAIRELANVDCHYWPEAEISLINALRQDRDESVRLEAALALEKGNCVGKSSIKALRIVTSGQDEDGRPSEKSERVKDAARKALKACEEIYEKQKPPENPPEIHPEKPPENPPEKPPF